MLAASNHTAQHRPFIWLMSWPQAETVETVAQWRHLIGQLARQSSHWRSVRSGERRPPTTPLAAGAPTICVFAAARLLDWCSWFGQRRNVNVYALGRSLTTKYAGYAVAYCVAIECWCMVQQLINITDSTFNVEDNALLIAEASCWYRLMPILKYTNTANGKDLHHSSDCYWY